MIEDVTFKNVYSDNKQEKDLSTREFFEKYSSYWKWFLLSILFSLLAAYFYIDIAPKQYEANTTILINDGDKGEGLNSELATFKDLGIMGNSRSSFETELDILKSRGIIKNVAKELRLFLTYYYEEGLSKREIFEEYIPIEINFHVEDSLLYNIDTTFSIKIISNDYFNLKDEDGELIKKGKFNKELISNFGIINIKKKENRRIVMNKEIFVKIKPLKNVITYYNGKIDVAPENMNSNLVKLSLVDPVKLKAEKILNNLVLQYNKDAVKYKDLIARRTDIFINDRIENVSKELTDTDIGVENYKKENRLTDIEYEASLNLESKAELTKEIVELNTQLKLVNFIIEHITNNKDDIIPNNLGLKDQVTSQSTADYNRILLERNRILKNSSRKNPTIINYDNQIEELKQGILQSLNNYKSSIIFSLNETRRQEANIIYKKNKAPTQEREFMNIKRKQQIFEGLYLYLLQKREQNAINLSVSAANAKVIDYAEGKDKAVEPKQLIIYMFAMFIGLLIPISFIYLKDLFDNKIHTVSDLEKVIQSPFLGDIPNVDTKKYAIIEKGDRSSHAEALRLIRTNLDYMFSGFGDKSKTIFVTSTIGGEGKSFTTLSLASIIALLNKKVLIVEADLRKPKLKKYLKIDAKFGISHYVINNDTNISEIISSIENTNIDIMLSGEIPPNPTDLLLNSRFEELLLYGQENYDYVLIDTPPLSLVADTLLLANHADLLIYIVRANFLDKRLLDKTKVLYNSNRLKNMATILNDAKKTNSGYGYGYGN